MRAVRVKVIGPEKRVRPRQKQCETILLLKSVSLKMSESEHSDSEFYYPGELSQSDGEMLQLPTHSKATERKSLLSKRSNAAARGLVPPKNENDKKWSYDKMLID